MERVTINQLPNELVGSILSFLDCPSALLEQDIYEDPVKIHREDVDAKRLFTSRTEQSKINLKNASLVCRLWRQCLLPLLFRHVSWRFERCRRPLPDQDPLLDVKEFEWLRFLQLKDLSRHVESLTITITYPEDKIGDDVSHHQHYGIQPSNSPALTRGNERAGAEDSPAPDNNWLWRTIFDQLDLSTITLISSPSILASLLGKSIDLSGAWLFRQRFHILSLSISTPASSKPNRRHSLPTALPSSSINPSCDLFSIRNWTSLVINEGSSVKAYSTYEYFNHTPPSLLPSLLDVSDPSTSKLLSSLSSLSYVAIFPLSTHIASTLVPRIPSLHRFYIQIVPSQLNFSEKHPAIDVNDFWVERNTAYAHLAMAIFDVQPSGAWRDLKVFESGDCSDREAWEQAVKFVVFNAGTRWKVGGDGVFLRREEDLTGLSLSGSG